MSKMKPDRKPPLAKSPICPRPGRVLRSNSTSLQTPPGFLTKSQKPIRTCAMEEYEIRPDYQSISCELRALARMVRDELGNGETENAGFGETSLIVNCSPLFERGRFYDEYSARRNERLKRKKGETGTESRAVYHLGVTVESSKRRESKKLECLRKSVSAAYSVERNGTQTPRYLLRSMSKENKKPPLAVNNYKSSMIGTEKKTVARRVRRV
ncbi:uncharacterized protein LOC111312907 [Durio zibethinus]|uniref:Uncharacterized protein LOC111312907 n=1 Tax=Durio zibethinus TaxID=66656 RepID=A0A6P6AX31_DURZI|nr:uncharacterized protein LOC111312907 [Durio zibethinus]